VTDPIALLADIPLFAQFSAAELERVARQCDDRRYEKGAVLWNVGDHGDELLVVAQGELAVWGRDGDIVAHLGPGDAVGEIALLLDEPRSATVTATRPTRALALSGADFDRFVRADARAMRAVGEMLSRRLKTTTRRRDSARHGLVVAVCGHNPDVVGIVAYALRDLLAHDTGVPVLHVDPGDVDVSNEFQGGRGAEAVAALLSSSRFPLVVVEAPADAGIDAADLARAVDVVVDIDGTLDGLATPRATRVLPIHVETARPCGDPNGRAAFALELGPELLRLPARTAARAIVDAPSSPAARTLGRLSRTVQGRVVGIALGTGAALGLAHIGVLSELERAGIPIDVVAGSSMGAVVGIAYAAGAGAHELERTARNLSSFLRLLRTVDVATTGDGLLGGRQLMQYLRPFYVGVDTFDDLVLPARVVTTDIARGERVAIGEGSIERALRASIAMPPFVAPVLWDDRTLVDGGIIDPVPCDVARELGADIVIGVSAVPQLTTGNATVLTRVSRGVNRLNPLAYLGGRLRSLNLLDVVMNSFQVVEHELSRYVGRAADVFVEPDFGNHTWIEFYRAPELMARGAEAGAAAIPEIERVLADHRARFVPDGLPAPAVSPATNGANGHSLSNGSVDGAAEVSSQHARRWTPVP
jgi:NTE family protein